MKNRILGIALVFVFVMSMLPVFSSAAVRGDVDGDSKVTASDARLALRCSVSLEKLNNKQTSAADINEDGKVTASDARSILRLSVGLSDDNAPSNQYEIIRSERFYIKGSISSDERNYEPMEMAMYGSTVYMESDFDGMDIAILVENGKNVYMIYSEKKAALHMSDTILSMAGMSVDELLSDSEMDFSDMPVFSQLKKLRTENFKGVQCTVYSYEEPDGTVEVYMNGNRLVRFVYLDKRGAFLSDLIVDSVSADVPAAYRSVPNGYKVYKGLMGMYSFMELLENGN